MKNLMTLALLLMLAACQGEYSNKRTADEFIATDEFLSQQITAFAEDSRGYIWISSIKGVSRYNGNNFYQFTLGNDSVDVSNVGVKCMVPDERGNMWLGSTYGILCHRYGEGIKRVTDHYVNTICDTSGDDLFYSDVTSVWRVNKLTYESSLVYRFMSPRLENQIIADDYGKLWTLESGYAKCFDIASGRLETQIDLQGVFLYAAKAGNEIYLSTDRGISMIDSKQGKLHGAEGLAELNKALAGDLATRVFRLNESSLILCTKGHHIYCFNTESNEVLIDDSPTFPLGGIPKEISSLFVDSRKNLWVGTDRGGYKAIFSRQTVFNRSQSLTSFFQDKAITAQCTDKEGSLWLVADKEDIYRWKRDEGVELILHRKEADIHRILIDGRGNLWMACKDCVRCGKIMNGTYRILGEWGISALSISADPMSNVYVCAYNGRICCKLAGYKDFQELTGKEHDYKGVKMITLHDGRMAMLESRTGVYITGIYLGTGSMDLELLGGTDGRHTYFNDFCEDDQGRLWVATTGRGVLCIDIDSRETKHYESDEYNSNVCSVIADETGQIWLGTSNGLTRIDPETDKIVTYYTDSGITGQEFATLGAIRMDDDFMVLCNMKGMTSFFARDLPDEISETLQLEYLSIDGNITQDLTLEGEVHLPHDNIGVDISFTSLRFGVSPPAYQYQMDGFDPGWNNIHGTEHAYYSHLPAGKYMFRVKLASANGDDSERTVRVIVHPPFWGMSVMLWGVYPLISLLLMSYFVWLMFRRKYVRERIRIAEMEKEQERRANEMNMRFFSNISHEFRTPLTLINGALAMIDKGNAKRMLEIMRSNSNRMIRMVNQLMDFNKMENGLLRLSVSKVSVSDLLREIVSMFEAGMKSRGMECRLELPSEDVMTWLDADKFEKIMVNLISNAMKYSGDGSSITIRLSVEGDELQVDVADTGVGVPEDKREEIFVRFYQLKQSGQLPAIGTGIGLYYTRSLVELHHGWIRCLGNEPHGSVFRVVLPMNEGAYTEDELCVRFGDGSGRAQASGEYLRAQTSGEYLRAQTSGVPTGGVSVMVVDDDQEVMEFLRLLLEPHYKINSYYDARTAYKEIEEVKPDLILSDVMMAEMDGYQFCQMIKDNSSICHVPVVLLTAKTAIEEQIHGLNCGASAYVTKPFSPEYLLSMIRTQLENVRRIQQSLSGSTKIPPKEEKVLAEADSKFMKGFYAYIEEHLTDAELKMDELTVTLGMSRSKLFYKTKALTGETPNAFFKAYKLNRAAEMILEGKEKIAYIAEMTGFYNSSHFSQNFKKRFGCLPSEYKK